MPKQPSATTITRAIPKVRTLWAGLNTSAETLIGALDAAPESLAISSGAWSLNKVIALAIRRVGRPCRLDLWTWTLSRRAIGQLLTWHRSGLVDVRLIVDASLWRRQPEYGRLLLADADFSGRVRAASAHAKAFAIRGPKGSIFGGGSGNLNLCRRAELVWLSRDPALADWLRGITTTAFAKLPAGAPERGGDTARADALSRAFPRPDVLPSSWAQGLPVLGAK